MLQVQPPLVLPVVAVLPATGPTLVVPPLPLDAAEAPPALPDWLLPPGPLFPPVSSWPPLAPDAPTEAPPPEVEVPP